MLIGSITRTRVACLCSCGKLRARNYERLHPPLTLPYLPTYLPPPDEIEFQPFLTFWPLAPLTSPEAGLIYIYWSIKSAKHELLWQPRYLNKRKPLLHRTEDYWTQLQSIGLQSVSAGCIAICRVLPPVSGLLPISNTHAHLHTLILQT